MKANFGLMPPPQNLGRNDRGVYYRDRSLTALRRFARDFGLRYDRDMAEATAVPIEPVRS